MLVFARLAYKPLVYMYISIIKWLSVKIIGKCRFKLLSIQTKHFPSPQLTFEGYTGKHEYTFIVKIQIGNEYFRLLLFLLAAVVH